MVHGRHRVAAAERGASVEPDERGAALAEPPRFTTRIMFVTRLDAYAVATVTATRDDTVETYNQRLAATLRALAAELEEPTS